MYEIIEKNKYGVLVRDEKDQFEYYLSALEAEKLETELTPETFTINDMYVESKLLFDCQDELESLQIENKQLKERIEELEQTIENMKAIAGEKIEVVASITSVDYQNDETTESLKSIPNDFCIEMYICSKCSAEIQEYYTFCPNCGRKIMR